MISRRPLPVSVLGAIGMLAALGAWMGCADIWGIPNRTLDPGVVCDAAGCSCKAPAADCDGDSQTGCEVDLETDSNHCGACGHGCLGAPCEEGSCVPVQLGEIENYVLNITELATDTHIVASGCDDQALYRVSKSGGDIEPLTTGFKFLISEFCAGDVYRVPDGVVFATGQRIFSHPLDDAAAATLVVQTPHYSMSPGGGYIYWLPGMDAAMDMRRMPISGGAEETHASVVKPYVRIVASDDAVFADVDGAPIQTIAHDTGEIAGSVNTKFTFCSPIFVHDGFLFCAAKFGEFERGILRAPAEAGDQEWTVLTEETLENIFFAADDTHLYWFDINGLRFRRLPLSGGEVETISGKEPTGYVYGLVVDDEAVYYVEDDFSLPKQRIMKLAK